MEPRYIDKYEEWNRPDYEEVNSEYFHRLEENVLYYKTAINLIKEELNNGEVGLENIKGIIGDLENELY